MAMMSLGFPPGWEKPKDMVRKRNGKMESRFPLLPGDSNRRSKFKQAAQSGEMLRLTVAVIREFPVFSVRHLSQYGSAESLKCSADSEMVLLPPFLYLYCPPASNVPVFRVLNAALVAFRGYFIQPYTSRG